MTKQGGMGDRLFIAGYDFSGDIGSIGDVGGGPAASEVTGIDKSALERIGVVRDGRINYGAYFNPSTNQEHKRLSLLPTADVDMMYCRGIALGGPVASMTAKQANYDGNRAEDGSFTFAVNAMANGYGLEWGNLLTAGKRTDTTATSPATGIDTTASAAFGAQAYLQVFAVTGTSVTVTIQDSADNATFANVTGLAFTAATGITTQRLATGNTATIRRYIRAITTGVFTNAVFAVAIVKNEIAGQVF